MERFHSPVVKRTRSVLFWMSLFNLGITCVSAIMHTTKFLGSGISPVSLIFGGVSMLHFLSSGMCLSAAMTGLDADFIRTCSGVCVFVFIVDFIIFLLRILLPSSDTFWFLLFVHVFSGSWIVFTAAEIIILSILLFQVTKWRNTIRRFVKNKTYTQKHKNKKIGPQVSQVSQVSQVPVVPQQRLERLERREAPLSNYEETRFWNMPLEVYNARKVLSYLWPIDLVLFLFFLLVFSPGFISNTWMTVLSILSMQHLIQWSWIRAVIGPLSGKSPEPGSTNPDDMMLSLTRVLVSQSILFDSISSIVRTYGIFVSPIISDAPFSIELGGAPISMFFSILSTSIVYAFVLNGILQYWYLQKLVTGLHLHITRGTAGEVQKIANIYNLKKARQEKND